jgi:hypothetical protein
MACPQDDLKHLLRQLLAGLRPRHRDRHGD